MSSIASTRYTSLRLSLQSKRKNIDSSQGKNNSDIRHFKLNLKFLKSSSFMSHYVIWLFAWQTQKFYKFWKYKILEYIRLCVIWYWSMLCLTQLLYFLRKGLCQWLDTWCFIAHVHRWDEATAVCFQEPELLHRQDLTHRSKGECKRRENVAHIQEKSSEHQAFYH